MKERIKRLRAKIAVQMVQKQSVHFRYLSSTGRFLNVYTLFLNSEFIKDSNNFYFNLFRNQPQNIPTHPKENPKINPNPNFPNPIPTNSSLTPSPTHKLKSEY